jgi:hypothetical protein
MPKIRLQGFLGPAGDLQSSYEQLITTHHQ